LRELNPQNADDLIAWAERVRLELGLLENILAGHATVKRFEHGEPVLSLTEEGITHVEHDLLHRVLREP
jgi:hypothetical protein